MSEFSPGTGNAPRKIGRYEIVGELGRGGMGVVYRGFDPTIGRTVAIKTVHLGTGRDDILMRFRREAQAAGLLSHPNIVTIYDAAEENGIFFIAMEYVEGDTLERVIQRGPVPVDEAIAIGADVGSALDLAHVQDVIHRDIKPANIMLARGRAKVMDFGVARIAASTATATGTVIGTPAYMSPESVSGKAVDGRSDIFSLAVVMYEMLTGKRPFPGESIPSVIYRILSEHPMLPTAINPGLHNNLDMVLMKALSKDPALRYQTAAEFVADLRNFRTLDVTAFNAAMLAAAGRTPTPASPTRTLAPPMVWGTVAMEAETVVVRPGQFPVPATPAPVVVAPVAVTPPPAPPPTKNRALPAVLAGLLLLTVGALSALLWQRQHSVTPAHEAAPAPVIPPAPAPATPPASAVTTPVPAAPVDHDVLVDSDVKGAAIHVDGKTKPDWLTPKHLHLAEGKHEIKVEKSGFNGAAKTIDVTAKGPKTAKLLLAALTVEIEITSTPPDAQVFVDSEEQDAHTPGKYTVAYGEHTFEVQKTGFNAEIRTMRVDGGTRGISVTLRRENGNPRGRPEGGRGPGNPAGPGSGGAIPPMVIPGTPFDTRAITDMAREAAKGMPLPPGQGLMVLRTIPNHVPFTVDDRPEEHTSPTAMPLPTGKHTVTFKLKSGESVKRDVEVTEGKRADVMLDLTKNGVAPKPETLKP